MKPVLTLAFLLCGCAAQIGTPSGPIVSASVGTGPAAVDPAEPPSLGGVIHNDLRVAIQIANAQSPPDIQAVACFTHLDARLDVLKGQAAGFIQPAGVISAFEAAHIGANRIRAGIAPANRLALETACGPYFMNVMGGINSLLGKIGVRALAFP